MERLRLDIVQACRWLRARPGAALAMVLILALGVGLVTAMFALADPFILRPLPYPRPEELVAVRMRVDRDAILSPSMLGVQSPSVADWQMRADLFAGLGAYRQSGDILRIRLPQGAAVLQTARVTEGFLEVLGFITPVDESDEKLSTPLVLTPQSSRRLFGGSGVAGRSFPRSDGESVRVQGELPRRFLFPSPSVIFPVEALVPVNEARFMITPEVTVIGRLRPGITPAAVRSALTATMRNSGARLSVQPLSIFMTGRIRPVALGAVAAGFVILLVCAANVANLLLVRGVYRAHELAVREALGASREDLARLALVEFSLVALTAVAAGLVVAKLALDVLIYFMPVEYLALGTPSVTTRVVAFACASGVLVLVAGLIPAAAIRRGTRGGICRDALEPETRRVRTVRTVLVAGQCTLAGLLLVNGALLGRSYANLVRQNTGFSAGAVVLSTSYPPTHTGPVLERDIDTTIQKLQRIPGVKATGAAVGSMLDRLVFAGAVTVDGELVRVVSKQVTPGYFEAVGNTVIAGRPFNGDERHRSALIITESLARRLWPNESALGRRLGPGAQPGEVVGVVRDEFNFALDTPPEPTVFTILEDPWVACSGSGCGQVSYVVGLEGAAGDITESATRAVTGVNADAVVFDAASIGDRLVGSIKDRSFATLVLGLFSVAGIGVCVTGLVGVIAYVVKRRTREIAICVAIGAAAQDVMKMVLAETLTAASVGILLAVLTGRWVSRILEHLVYQVKPGDWWTSVLAASLMLAIATIAVLVPARRALRLSPNEALRVE